MVAEPTATHKWCPFARVLYINGAFNRLATGKSPESAHCIGSECMAWRWFGAGEPEGGYCGLAGREGAI